MRVRVILQVGTCERLGILFDDDGVRGIYERDIDKYADGKPCCLLVNADVPWTSPLRDFGFCSAAIVVTSPNLRANPELKSWRKQVRAKRFVATPPSCLEVVYLLCVKFFNYHSSLINRVHSI
jgi:hypothetical protein